MKKSALLILVALCIFIPKASASGNSDLSDTENRHWFSLLKKGELSLQDTTVVYPPFLKFCVNTYNTVDRIINQQDTDYVANTNRSWNVHLINDNWTDSYYLNIDRKMPITMMSDIYNNAGAYIQYSSISLGYSVDLSNIIGNEPSYHKKFKFAINAARFNLEANLWDNTGGTYIRSFGRYNSGHLIKVHFPGATQRTVGLTGDYYFNYRKFSMGAAYNSSRIQKRSVGTPVVGFNLQRIDVNMDFTRLPAILRPALTFQPRLYRFHYNSYAISGGYSYNWLMTNHLLFNITCYPGIGYTHTYEDSENGGDDLMALTLRAKSSLTYNLGDIFLCSAFYTNTNRYQKNNITCLSSIYNLHISIGVRF